LGSRRFGIVDLSVYAAGVAGLSACLTLIWLSMRAVMNVGGFCAEGGPYVIDTPCPEGVPLVLTLGIFGLFGFGGLMLWKGSVIGGPYGLFVALAWPALFLSLGWNFLDYAFNPPGPPGQGIVWGWLIPGVMFVIMGGLPLLAVLPIGHSGRSGRARATLAQGVAPRKSASSERRDTYRRLASDLRAFREKIQADEAEAADEANDLVSRLERLAALRRAGDLTFDEYDRAKQALIADASRT
jgi:hypothetical protein